jgi:predicted metalloprotease with PDZ domain
MTSQLGVLSWNQVLLYPAGTPSDKIEMKASVKLPQGWRFGTALPIARESGETIEFQPASLTTMVDSPVIAGRNFRTVELGPAHYLHIAADNAAALDASKDKIEKFQNLVQESGVLYGSRHYRTYHFLLTLSDNVAHFGLEHHESSDDRLREQYLTDDDQFRASADLLPHEMTHSWNGKFRRPDGLATGDYEKPMDGELLWVYEGLTNYLGEVLAARSGLWTDRQWRENLAMTAAEMDARSGRGWRPLADTATAAQLLYSGRSDGEDARRSTDYYPEGSLIWLEADVLIRRESQGKKSLDDFILSFYGGTGGKPELKPYTADELYAALNAIQPYDWKTFFRQRVYEITPRAPLGGIANGGWNLVFRDEPTEMIKSREAVTKGVDMRYSAGLSVSGEGRISDVRENGAAAKAGIAAGTQIIAIDGRQFSKTSARAALKASKGSKEPLEFLIKDGEFYKTYKVDSHTGDRHPDLERDTAHPDILAEIVKARVK